MVLWVMILLQFWLVQIRTNAIVDKIQIALSIVSFCYLKLKCTSTYLHSRFAIFFHNLLRNLLWGTTSISLDHFLHEHFFKKMGQSRPLFVYFCSFLITISIIQIEKSIDGVLGIRTWDRRMVGADKTMELWQPPNTSTILKQI